MNEREQPYDAEMGYYDECEHGRNPYNCDICGIQRKKRKKVKKLVDKMIRVNSKLNEEIDVLKEIMKSILGRSVTKADVIRFLYKHWESTAITMSADEQRDWIEGL